MKYPSWFLADAGGVLSKGRALLLPLLDCKDYTGIFKLQGVEREEREGESYNIMDQSEANIQVM